MKTESPANLSSRLNELDGLRGLLALWVAVSHIFCWTGFWESAPLGINSEGAFWRNFIIANGAVDTFMILSGFVITFLIHRQSQSYGQFMMGRFFRLYPVYIICLLAGLLTTYLAPFIFDAALWGNTEYFVWNKVTHQSELNAPVAHLFWHLTLLHGVVPDWLLYYSTSAFLPPAWSISLEWQYYLVAPLIATVSRTGFGILLLALIAALGLRYGGPWENMHQAFLPAQLALFLVGIGSYHFYGWCVQTPASRQYQQLFPAILLAVAIITKWHITALAAWAVGFGCIFSSGYGLYSRLLAGVSSLLKHRWLQHLGNISYPLYLIHWPLIIVSIYGLLKYKPSMDSVQALLWVMGLGLPLILLVAHLIHLYVERPAMQFGKRFSQPSAKAITAA